MPTQCLTDGRKLYGQAQPEIICDALPCRDALRGGVLALGNFDGVHLGHRSLVHQARHLAMGRPVGVMSCEPHPRSFFTAEQQFRLSTSGSKLRLLERERVDYIYAPRFDKAFAGLSPEVFAEQVLRKALGVSAVVAGEDFRFGRGRTGDIALLSLLGERYGFSSHVASVITWNGIRISSTRIRDALRSGDMQTAEGLLGASWLVEVVPGPNARLHLHPHLCRPKAGIYFGKLEGRPPCRVKITDTGAFLPVGPSVPGFWHLSAKDLQAFQ